MDFDSYHKGLGTQCITLNPSTKYELRRTETRASLVIPPKGRCKPADVINQSSSLPCNFFAACAETASNSEGIDDATVFLVAPSCADLTAYASTKVLNNLDVPPYELYKSRTPTSTSLFNLSSKRSNLVDLLTAEGSKIVNQPLCDMHSAEDLLVDLDKVPHIDLTAQQTTAHKYSVSSPPYACRQSIHSYDIIGTIGKGTYGKVVLARLKGFLDQELYAVKIMRNLNGQLGLELACLRLFLKASKASNKDLEVMGVVFLQQLREVFQDDHKLFIVLEYHPATLADPEISSRFRLFGDSLSEIPASVSLPLTFTGLFVPRNSDHEKIKCLRILIAEITLGLVFLHDQGIVHQDIKPANIMLSFEGHVVIGDFGAATQMPFLDPSEPQARLGRYGPIVLDANDLVTFTPLYAAPELQERNSGELVIYDERSDWWSFGILLYELITGSVPFHTTGGCDMLRLDRRSVGDRSIAFGELETLSSHFNQSAYTWYPHLEQFIRSLLSHDPAYRLAWPDIQDHDFLNPLQGLWGDIADMKFPPCPNPSMSEIDGDASLDMEDGKDSKLDVADPTISDGSQSSVKNHFCGEQSNESSLRPEVSLDLNPFRSSVQITLVPTWCPPYPSLFDDTSDGSLQQALPSSASIFPALERPGQSYTPRFHISQSPTFHEIPKPLLLQSPFSSTPVICPSPSTYSDDPSLSLHLRMVQDALPLNCDLVMVEKITLSLLRAMDNRDASLATMRNQRKQPWYFRKVTFGWAWRKLFSWRLVKDY